MVEKPAGVLSQTDAAGGDSLPRRLEELGTAVLTVHRLDRDTGGVMVFARTRKAAAVLSKTVGQHEIFQKTYLAVVNGCPQEAEGRFEDLLYHDVKRNKSFVVKRPRNGVRKAALSYTLLHTVSTQQGTYSLIQVQLHTGRTHQIRVQFASRGMPLVGDNRYGGGRACPLALWSHRLTFPHPISGEPVVGRSLPDITIFPWNLFRIEA